MPHSPSEADPRQDLRPSPNRFAESQDKLRKLAKPMEPSAAARTGSRTDEASVYLRKSMPA